jgi:pentatricopeptide repeat protein
MMISRWCKIGRIEDAAKVFDEMLAAGEVKPTAVMYNALIGGYCDKGKLDVALQYRDDMVERGMTRKHP